MVRIDSSLEGIRLTQLDIDIYIAMVSHEHEVCPKDYHIAIVSTIVETDKPELELAPGLKLLGPIFEK